MEEEKNKCQLCEEIKKDRKFPGCFADWMNATAFAVIFVIIITFLHSIYNFRNIEILKENQTPIEFKSTGDTKLDEEKFNEIVDLKLKEFKQEIQNSEKERNENMKYYSALVGFILSIVGLFGFKSIHDTRQAAIEKAVFDAKKEATEVAKKEASSIAKDVANEEAKKEAKKVSKSEIDRYLTDEHTELFNRLEKPIRSHYDPIITEYSNRIDTLERPGIYNNEINQFNEKLSANYTEINNRINKLEKELIEKEIELLKLKAKK
jgi:hypothetical protein